MRWLLIFITLMIPTMPAAAADLPAGISERDTDEGRVFTDARGMTLYLRADPKPCTLRAQETRPDLHRFLQIYAEYYKAPSCLQQWPAVMAPAGASPSGDWMLIDNADGKQWAYRGKAVHTYYKDLLPGDVNGAGDYDFFRENAAYVSWDVALTTHDKLPPGVRAVRRAGVGTIAVAAGRTLYVVPTRNTKATASDEKWLPLRASESARSFGRWTVEVVADGSPVWAYNNRVLYSYVGDHTPRDANGIGVDGASVVVLRALPRSPPGITMKLTPIGTVYADNNGMTLYQFACVLPYAYPDPSAYRDASRRFTCDGWQDDVAQREQFCPGIDNCGEMWRPVVAGANEAPRGGIWSIGVIPDPKHPLRWMPATAEALQKPGAIRVRMYRGRPLYISSRDSEPGDYFASAIHLNSGQRWTVVRADDDAPN